MNSVCNHLQFENTIDISFFLEKCHNASLLVAHLQTHGPMCIHMGGFGCNSSMVLLSFWLVDTR